MGTKIQSKTYLPGYYVVRDVNNNVGNGWWPIYEEERASRNGHHNGSFWSQRPPAGHLELEREKVRQTILRHESIFRYQLQELHRVYKKQIDLMNEIRRRELHQDQTKGQTQQNKAWPCFPSEDVEKNSPFLHDPPLRLVLGELSASQTVSQQAPFDYRNGKGICSTSVAPNQQSSESYRHLNSASSKLAKILDLEMVPDECNHLADNGLSERSHRLLGSTSGSGHSDTAGSTKREPLMKPHMYFDRSSCLADLNEPTQLEEGPISASVDTIGNATCHGYHKDSNDESRNPPLHFDFLAKRSYLATPGGRNAGGLDNLQKDRESTQQTPYPRAGQISYSSTIRNISSCSSPAAHQLMQVERKKADEFLSRDPFYPRKTVGQGKKRIFGVEISEGNDESLVIISKSAHTTPASGSFITDYFLLSSSRKISDIQGDMVQKIHNSSNPHSYSEMQTLGLLEGNMLHAKDQYSKDQVLNHCIPESDANDQNVPLNGNMTDLNINCMSPEEQAIQHNSLSADFQDTKEDARGTPTWLKPEGFGEKIPQVEGSIAVKPPPCHPEQLSVEIVSARWSDQKLENPLSSSATENISKGSNLIQAGEVLGFSVLNPVSAFKDLNSENLLSEPGCSDADHSSNLKTSCSDRLESEEFGKKEKLSGYISGLRHSIDLNLASNEEETASGPSIPEAIMKIATTEIDLEAPAVLESEPETAKSPETVFSLSNLPHKEPQGTHEVLRLAAEALFSLSLSCHEYIMEDKYLQEDCLNWFAEVVSTYVSTNNECKSLEISSDVEGKNDKCSILGGMDYFELMTLKLQETKEEDYCFKLPIMENQNEEETEIGTLLKRSRRGQARRGRQRKDFQRDILPGLISLARNEVTEDIQTFEEMFKARGYFWQPGLSKRKGTKRGRRASRVTAPLQNTDLICPLPEKQLISGELGIHKKSLTGWGRRTRRLPRQRCPNGITGLVSKQC